MKRKIVLSIVAILVVNLLLVGCSSTNVDSNVDDINDNMQKEFTFLVVDKNETPINNAKVTFNNIIKMTDEDGKTTFNVSNDIYDLKVEKETFADYSDSVEVNSDIDNYIVRMRLIDDIARPQSPKINIQQDGNSINLTWDPITKNIDGESTEIEKYEVHGDAVNYSSSIYASLSGDKNNYQNDTFDPYGYEFYVIAIDKYGKESKASNIVKKISTNIETREVNGSMTNISTSYNQETGIMKVDYEAEAPIKIYDATYKDKFLNGNYDIQVRLTEERIPKIQKVETHNFNFNNGYAEKYINFTASYEYQITWDYGYHPIYPDDPKPVLSIIFDKVPTDLQ